MTPSGATPATGTARVVERSLRRRRSHYADEVQRLVDATLAVMQERETADPTVGDILARAGLSTTALYRHFPTKDDLIVVLLEQAHELTAAHIEARMREATDPLERIELWVRAVFDLVRTHQALGRNRALLLAHPRLLQAFPDQISTGFAVLAWPLQVAIADARDHAGRPRARAELDARLALNQVFSILIDAAALRTPPASAVVDATVAYTIRAAVGTTPAPEGAATD